MTVPMLLKRIFALYVIGFWISYKYDIPWLDKLMAHLSWGVDQFLLYIVMPGPSWP